MAADLSRIVVVETDDALRVVIRSRATFEVWLLGMWLGGGALLALVGVAHVAAVASASRTYEMAGLLLLFVALFMVGRRAVTVLWMLVGREEILVDHRKLVMRKYLFGLARSRVFALASVQGIRWSDASLRGARRLASRTLLFEIDKARVRTGRQLTFPEANHLETTLRRFTECAQTRAFDEAQATASGDHPFRGPVSRA